MATISTLPTSILSTVAGSSTGPGDDRVPYRVMEGGYRRAAVTKVDGFELAWLRWPARSYMPLRGYSGTPSYLLVVSGALSECLFVPNPRGYKFLTLTLAGGISSELP